MSWHLYRVYPKKAAKNTTPERCWIIDAGSKQPTKQWTPHVGQCTSYFIPRLWRFLVLSDKAGVSFHRIHSQPHLPHFCFAPVARIVSSWSHNTLGGKRMLVIVIQPETDSVLNKAKLFRLISVFLSLIPHLTINTLTCHIMAFELTPSRQLYNSIVRVARHHLHGASWSPIWTVYNVVVLAKTHLPWH